MSTGAGSAGVTSGASDAVRARSAEAVRVGGYAQGEVEIASPGEGGEPVELSLAAPFGPLFSALFDGRPLRVSSLSLTYVALEQLGRLPTFSVKLRELREGGEAQVSLLVFQGARVCVRGEAVVALGQANGERHS